MALEHAGFSRCYGDHRKAVYSTLIDWCMELKRTDYSCSPITASALVPDTVINALASNYITTADNLMVTLKNTPWALLPRHKFDLFDAIHLADTTFEGAQQEVRDEKKRAVELQRQEKKQRQEQEHAERREQRQVELAVCKEAERIRRVELKQLHDEEKAHRVAAAKAAKPPSKRQYIIGHGHVPSTDNASSTSIHLYSPLYCKCFAFRLVSTVATSFVF
ncbi:hypothetical protein H0H92_001629 [Tricholoma furcatifolium]|nr:hypothetical protein H0H92_001629 [Tricholoma furcatifolium]